MTAKGKAALWGGIFFIASVLFVPFGKYSAEHGWLEFYEGHRFVLGKWRGLEQVNFLILLAEWAIVGAVIAVALYLAKQKLEEPLPQMARDDFAAGRLEAGLAALRTAEGLGPDLAAVRALRGELYRATARRHRDAASALILEAAESDEFAAADNLRLRRHFLMAHLFEALALAREDQVEACRQSLQAAATYADSQHALVQRTARRLDLGEELVRVLLLRLDPQLQNWLGSAAGETAAEPEREAAEAADEEG